MNSSRVSRDQWEGGAATLLLLAGVALTGGSPAKAADAAKVIVPPELVSVSTAGEQGKAAVSTVRSPPMADT